jgi:hypothetical protein
MEDGGGRYSPMTNQKFRGGSINNTDVFIYLKQVIYISLK